MYRIPFKTGDEQDILGSRNGRKVLCWAQRAGATARVKRGYRRRERHTGREECRAYLTR